MVLVKRNRILFSVFLLLVAVGPYSFSQALAQNSEVVSKISFESEKRWEAARWYAIGRWVAPNRIQWVGGGQSLLEFSSATCLSKENYVGQIVRSQNSSKQDEVLEVFQQKDFFALELPTDLSKEKLKVTSGQKLKVDLQIPCEIEIEVQYAWVKTQPSETKVSPLVFLSPTRNLYFGYEFEILIPNVKPEGLADVQLDILGGYARAKFPSVASTGVCDLNLFPVARARGEWLPFTHYWGMNLSLEQVMASWGGAKTDAGNQSALYSDWSLGTFLEDFYPVFDSIQVRLGLSYLEHSGDDNPLIPTLLPANKNAAFLVGTLTTGIYFSDRWLLGGDFTYGPPVNFKGNGKQSYLSVLGRVGMRVTGFLFLLSETGFKTYTTSGSPSDSVIQAHVGIRLDL